MAFLAPLIGMGASLLGGLFGKNQSQTQTQTTTPNLSPTQQALSNSILGAGQNMLTSSQPSLTGYASSAIQGNNQQNANQMSALRRTLAARGLTSSPMATSATTALRMSGANQNQQVINQLPLLQRQLLQQSLGSAIDAFRSSPYGQTSTGNMQGNTNLGVGGSIGSGLGTFGSIASGMGLQGFGGSNSWGL